MPLAVKIAPDLDDAQIDDIARIVPACGIDAVIATNTTIDKSALGASPLAQEAGGLSGAPVFAPSNRVLKKLADAFAGSLPLIGVGGILSGGDAKHKLDLGATAVQVYSGMVYRGPGLVKECLAACR